MPKNVNIEDVAKLAGVSISTVSRVINKFPSVKTANRIRVEKIIKQLKFKPNLIAKALVQGRSSIIALVFPHYEGIFYSYYGLEVIRGIGTICDNLKLDMLLHISGQRKSLNMSNIGGIIFADVFKDEHSRVEEALASNVPAVVINNLIRDLAVTCVYIDNKKGAEDAVNYLLDLGHKTIAHISGGFLTEASRERIQGYKSALTKRGLLFKEELLAHGDYSRHSAREAAEKLLSLKIRPTAVFAASDDMAQEVISVIMEKGLNVPGDISVIGFDDNPISLYGPVPLTTVRQPLMQMAQVAVKELDMLMKGEGKVSKFSLPAQLVIRDSCRPLK